MIMSCLLLGWEVRLREAAGLGGRIQRGSRQEEWVGVEVKAAAPEIRLARTGI